jgi:hypothetical protein
MSSCIQLCTFVILKDAYIFNVVQVNYINIFSCLSLDIKMTCNSYCFPFRSLTAT